MTTWQRGIHACSNSQTSFTHCHLWAWSTACHFQILLRHREAVLRLLGASVMPGQSFLRDRQTAGDSTLVLFFPLSIHTLASATRRLSRYNYSSLWVQPVSQGGSGWPARLPSQAICQRLCTSCQASGTGLFFTCWHADCWIMALYWLARHPFMVFIIHSVFCGLIVSLGFKFISNLLSSQLLPNSLPQIHPKYRLHVNLAAARQNVQTGVHPQRKSFQSLEALS